MSGRLSPRARPQPWERSARCVPAQRKRFPRCRCVSGRVAGHAFREKPGLTPRFGTRQPSLRRSREVRRSVASSAWPLAVGLPRGLRPGAESGRRSRCRKAAQRRFPARASRGARSVRGRDAALASGCAAPFPADHVPGRAENHCGSRPCPQVRKLREHGESDRGRKYHARELERLNDAGVGRRH